jgi:pyruvate-formate lyase
VLLLTLSDGSVPPRAPGQGVGFRSGALASVRSFDELLAAFERQLRHQLDTLIAAIADKDRAHRELLPAPYVSALVDGCIESAADVTAGGARYDFTSIDVRGLATTVDSLLAIEWLVYQRREHTLEELWRIVLGEFRDHEALRQRLRREPPKHGRSEPHADAMTMKLVAMLHGLVDGRRNVRGGRYRLAYFSLGNHVIDGIFLGATPDGRLGGSPISNGVSPSDGIELPGGAHGVMRSMAKLPPPQVSSGIALNLRFHPHVIEHERGLGVFAGMLRTYFAQGGMQLQPNVVSAETLRAAQRHPERYRDLVVKVSGYSACFTDLGRAIQEDIISRAELGGAQ